MGGTIVQLWDGVKGLHAFQFLAYSTGRTTCWVHPEEGDDLVAVDGKELLHSGGIEIVSAYRVKSGRRAGSEAVAKDSNEIPAAQELLRRAPIEGSLVVADALHTQTETRRIITQGRGADYLFTVKGKRQKAFSIITRRKSKWLPN